MPSRDITNPQSLNRYTYVLNNPTTNIDPSGLTNIPGYDLGGRWGGGSCSLYVACGLPTPGGFGSNWNEFDLLNTPAVTESWVPASRVSTTWNGATTWGPISPGYWATFTVGNAFELSGMFSSQFAAPVGPNGEPLPPPVALAPGKDGQPNSWRWVPGTAERPQKWVPAYPVPSAEGGQPSASWEDSMGQWDIDDGHGNRTRVDPSGNPVNHPMSIVPTAAKAAATAGAASVIIQILEALGEAAAFAL